MKVIFKQNGNSGNSLTLITGFLKNRRQRTVSNDQFSLWAGVNNAGVLQGSISEPLLFLMYINDLTNEKSSRANHFADNTTLF